MYRSRMGFVDLQQGKRKPVLSEDEVEPFIMAPDAHPLDYHVDVPPYSFSPHLKLQLGKYVATSAGIVVRRGR